MRLISSSGIWAFAKYNTVTAVAGAHNIKKNETTQQKKVLSEFKKHPNYNSNNISNDVATLKFESAFELNEFLVPMCPPVAQTAEWMQEGWKMHVCGWVTLKSLAQTTHLSFIASIPNTFQSQSVTHVTTTTVPS